MVASILVALGVSEMWPISRDTLKRNIMICVLTTGKNPWSLSGTALGTARPCDFGSSGPLSGRPRKHHMRDQLVNGTEAGCSLGNRRCFYRCQF